MASPSNPFGIGGATGPFPVASADMAGRMQAQSAPNLPTAPSQPYGSGASAPATFGNRSDIFTPLGMTPPTTPAHSPPPPYLRRIGGTTRRDRDERANERRAARDANRAEREPLIDEGLEQRIHDWNQRLLHCEQSARDNAQMVATLLTRFQNLEDKINPDIDAETHRSDPHFCSSATVWGTEPAIVKYVF